MPIFVRLLGTVDVCLGNTVMTIGPQKRRAMLAALALAANRPVSLKTLAETLWGSNLPASATKNLRSHAHALRALVGRRLVTHSGAYELKLDADELDATRFAALAHRGDYGEALALWRGSALTGVPRTPQLDAVVAGLTEHKDAVFEEYCHASLRAGATSELVPGLRRHLAAQPYRERAWGALMLAQYRSGDVYGALSSFGQAQSVLREQLGVDPGPELVELHRAILARDPRLDLPAKFVRAPARAP